MKDIKIIVSVLCKHLNYLFNIKLKPELFRLAKHNKSDENVVKTFWILLRKMLEIPHTGNDVRAVKQYYLNVFKYKSLYFYSLPEDMSSGSRELLLALAYLIANNYLNNFITNFVRHSVFNPNFQVSSYNSIQAKEYNFDLAQVENEVDFKNMLKWIEGQIQHNKREYDEYRENIHNLLLKRNKCYDSNNQLSSLSELEIIALSNEKDCKEFLEKSEIVSKVIHLHTKWLMVQPHFWGWMSSVIFEKENHIKELNVSELNKYCRTL